MSPVRFGVLCSGSASLCSHLSDLGSCPRALVQNRQDRLSQARAVGVGRNACNYSTCAGLCIPSIQSLGLPSFQPAVACSDGRRARGRWIVRGVGPQESVRTERRKLTHLRQWMSVKSERAIDPVGNADDAHFDCYLSSGRVWWLTLQEVTRCKLCQAEGVFLIFSRGLRDRDLIG